MNMQGKYAVRCANICVTMCGAIAITLSAGTAAYAQNSVQQTPPELRDFRLDPEKPKPKPAPLPADTEVPATRPGPGPAPSASTPRAPQQVTPRAVITVPDVRPDQPRSAPPRSVTPRSEPFRPAPVPKTAPAPVKPNASAALPQVIPTAQLDAVPEPVIADPTPPTPATSVEPSADNTATSSAPADAAAYPYWWITAGALALVCLVAVYAGMSFFRRRRSGAAREDLHYSEPEPAISTTPAAPLPVPQPTAVTAAAAPKHVLKRPNLDISFIPEKATISLAKLTIKGQIRIINQGNSAANSMRLRAVIISANIHQEQQIAAFHAHTQTPGDDVGAAAVGERIAMDIDLVIPLSELSSFAMGTKQLFAPIVAAHVDYAWGKNIAGADAAEKCDTARISCLIGREATPPKPKMGPLRLDLGPRSFAPLGQRPVFG